MSEKKKAATKSAMYSDLANATGLTKKQVGEFFEQLGEYIGHQIGKKGPGTVVIPGLMKIRRKEKPAQPARMGKNPRTGEPIEIKAKPKSVVPRVLALKGLKEMVK